MAAKSEFSKNHKKIRFVDISEISPERYITGHKETIESLKNRVNFPESCPLRTTTKFTTTTSVDWERTGTRQSVSAGKRKLKMQSTGRSTTTTLNVNKHVEVVQL